MAGGAPDLSRSQAQATIQKNATRLESMNESARAALKAAALGKSRLHQKVNAETVGEAHALSARTSDTQSSGSVDLRAGYTSMDRSQRRADADSQQEDDEREQEQLAKDEWEQSRRGARAVTSQVAAVLGLMVRAVEKRGAQKHKFCCCWHCIF